MGDMVGCHIPGVSNSHWRKTWRVDSVEDWYLPKLSHSGWLETEMMDGMGKWYFPGMSNSRWWETWMMDGVGGWYFTGISHRGWGRQEEMMVQKGGITQEWATIDGGRWLRMNVVGGWCLLKMNYSTWVMGDNKDRCIGRMVSSRNEPQLMGRRQERWMLCADGIFQEWINEWGRGYRKTG